MMNSAFGWSSKERCPNCGRRHRCVDHTKVTITITIYASSSSNPVITLPFEPSKERVKQIRLRDERAKWRRV